MAKKNSNYISIKESRAIIKYNIKQMKYYEAQKLKKREASEYIVPMKNPNNLIEIEDLKKYKLLGTEYTIPTLEEVLELTKGQVPIMVELKSFAVFSVGKFEQKVYDIMKHYDGQYAIQAFNPLTINWFKKNAPEVIRGQLWCLFEDVAELPRFAKHILRKMYLTRRSRPDFLAYSADDISKKYLKKFKKTPKLGWVIHSEEEEEKTNEIFSGVIFEDYLPDGTESKKA